ncbi:putative bicarbonate transporter [Septoria linicola]|nr:putative bicarbonate transporter [Septoria linicola]
MPGLEKSKAWSANFATVFRQDGTLRPGRLLQQDAKKYINRWPSDWKIFNQLVLASAVYVFFTNLLPGITFASDLYQRTGQNWGTIEIVFGTGLCGIIFSLFSLQPLVILGITGPFTVLAENIYKLCSETFEVDFLQFMAWTLIHSGWMHILLAVLNAHDWTMLYVTEFSCEIFSLLNSIIYFHKAVQELERAHGSLDQAAFLYAIIGAVGTFMLALFLSTAEHWPPIIHKYFRMGLREYAAAISIIFFIGMPYVGELKPLDKDTLYTSSESFRPTRPGRENFYVKFWRLPAPWVFAAMIPGFIITVLFFFDHEISSIICTIRRYGIRKPTGYAQDIVLLGLTTTLCGVLGIPPANGLLPQAPLHSESVMYDDPNEIIEESIIDKHGIEHIIYKPVQRVHEQRWSHFLHAAAIFAFIAPPLQLVLGLTPTSVLAGLFLFMGQQSLSVNPILQRTLWAITPPSDLPPLPENIKSWWPVHAYTLFEIVMAVVIFIVTLTIAGPAFPLIIAALVPFRLLVMNRIWSRNVLRYVDQWACRDGSPEDGDEDGEQGRGGSGGDVEKGLVFEQGAASTGVDVDVEHEVTKR